MATNPMHQFNVHKIGPEIKINGIDLSFTNSSLFMLLSAIFILLFLLFGTKEKKIIPGKIQLISEMLYNFIGKMINDYPELQYICGGEESFGFLAGNHVRDKDAITSALILSELCNELKNKNSSFYDRLIECYINYGFFKEKLITEIAKGKKGVKEIDDKINSFRNGSKILNE